MRIDPNQGLAGSQGTAADRVGGAASSSSTRTQQSAGGPELDQASLSADAIQYSKLRSGISNIPDVRADRVASVQKAIQSGAYSVSNQQIATALQRDAGPAATSGK